jgi:mono/diheme cytochrome c family protein
MTTTFARGCLVLFVVLVFSLSQVLPASAQDGSEGPQARPSPEIAASIYQDRCANCHGPSGQGDGAQALQVNLSIPDLTDPAVLRATTPARWFDIVSNGVEGKAMPPFGAASSNPIRQIDRWNLVFYLYTLGTPPAQVAMGQALYERSCVACHGEDGAGSDEAPGFTDMEIMANRSQIDLFDAIEEHDLDLGDVEIWALTDYVRTFSYGYLPADTASELSMASPFTDGAGIIEGQIINGTSGAAPPTGGTIQLRAFDMNANFIDAITTTVAVDGSFRFQDIDTTIPIQYEPLIVYQEIPYFGDLESALTLSPDEPEADVGVTVYETTQDPADIRIERLHMVLDLAPAQVQIAELYILSNLGDRTFVGTLEQGTLPLTVPPDALSFQPGGDPNRYLTLADGIADTIPIRPGPSTGESVLVYELAYDGELELDRPLPYPTSMVNVFVPADSGIEISGDQIEATGPFQAQNTTLNTYVASDLSAGTDLTFRISGAFEGEQEVAIPSPHQGSGPSQTQSIVIGSLFLAGVVAVTFLYWGGRLRPNPAAADGTRQEDLLQAIADLDDDYEAGRVDEAEYLARRAQLKEELVALMEREA